MTLMRLRGVWTANASALLTGVGMYASSLIIPEFVQAPARLGYGLGASVTGVTKAGRHLDAAERAGRGRRPV